MTMPEVSRHAAGRIPLEDSTCLIDLPILSDGRGCLTFLEGGRHIPFEIARVYYLYDVPRGQTRAGHAHFALRQVMIAAAGSFDVYLTNGFESKTVTLNRPDCGLLMSNLVWRELHSFSAGAVCLVLASEPYDEADYIRSYDKFIEIVGGEVIPPTR